MTLIGFYISCFKFVREKGESFSFGSCYSKCILVLVVGVVLSTVVILVIAFLGAGGGV
jgi:hypothetical protein